MAKSNWGITSGFIGKLGNVVGFNWKGKNVQRALTQTSNPNTKGQVLQRTRFALITRTGGDLYEAIYEGYRREANNLRTTQNGLFVKDNLNFVIGDEAADLVVDFGKLQLSSGKLNGVDFGQASVSGNVLSVSITDNNLYGRRVSANDRIYLVAYCPELGDARCQSVGTRSSESALTLNLPAKWGNKRVYAYGFVIGAAAYNEGLASKTVYLGAFGEGGTSGSGNETPGGNGSGNGGNSGNGGSSNETPTVAAPTISGTTPFAETTQVTITGSNDTRVYYTTDGSTPTSGSTLYTEPFTLSATTTVKAIAIKDEVSSSVASKTFTKSSGGGNDTE